MNLYDAPVFLSGPALAAEVERMTFMPGWELSVFLDPFEGPVFRVVAKVPNSYSDEPVTLQINSRIPWQTSIEDFRLWCLWRCDQIMRHETREWFKIDGKPLYDPHDPVEPALRG